MTTHTVIALAGETEQGFGRVANDGIQYNRGVDGWTVYVNYYAGCGWGFTLWHKQRGTLYAVCGRIESEWTAEAAMRAAVEAAKVDDDEDDGNSSRIEADD